MARKQLGAVDEGLLSRVDAAAKALGQTRRVFVERACERALEAGPTPGPHPAGTVEPQPGNSSLPAPASSRAPSGLPRAREPYAPRCATCNDLNTIPPDGDGEAEPCPERCATCTRNGPPRTRPCAKCGHKA